jgi:hypothetical protein
MRRRWFAALPSARYLRGYAAHTLRGEDERNNGANRHVGVMDVISMPDLQFPASVRCSAMFFHAAVSILQHRLLSSITSSVGNNAAPS